MCIRDSVIGEMAYGRGMKSGPVGAFSKAMEMRFGKKGKTWGKIIGMIPVIGSLGIAIGYSVVVGRFLKYLFSAVTGSLLNVENTGAYFGELAVDFGSIGWHMLGLALTFIIIDVYKRQHEYENLKKIYSDVPVLCTDMHCGCPVCGFKRYKASF